jgi:hypothetical protein
LFKTLGVAPQTLLASAGELKAAVLALASSFGGGRENRFSEMKKKPPKQL